MNTKFNIGDTVNWNSDSPITKNNKNNNNNNNKN